GDTRHARYHVVSPAEVPVSHVLLDSALALAPSIESAAVRALVFARLARILTEQGAVVRAAELRRDAHALVATLPTVLAEVLNEGVRAWERVLAAATANDSAITAAEARALLAADEDDPVGALTSAFDVLGKALGGPWVGLLGASDAV